MAYYESVFIARQDISATQAEGLSETFSKVISDNGGTVVNTESWGLRTLAYRIKKNRKGHYMLFNIDAPAPAIHEMERQMRINEDILRYLTIKVDTFEEGPSVMMPSRQRDDRPRRFNDDRPKRDDGDKKVEDAAPATVAATDSGDGEGKSEGAEA